MFYSRIATCLFIAAFCSAEAATPGAPSTVVMVGGNGQVVQENFATVDPLTIRVTDAAGIPVAGVAVSWSIPQQYAQIGSLNQPVNQTDSNGLATAKFVGGAVQPGTSYAPATIVASTPVGNISFIVSVVPVSTQQPFVSFTAPTFESNFTVTGQGGTTLSAAVVAVVTAQGGINLGSGIPNVGLYIADVGDSNAPPAACNGTAGIALSDSHGVATCDLVLQNTPGTYALQAKIAGVGKAFTLKITPGQSCNFALTPTSASAAVQGGSGTVNVTTTSGCTWTATTTSNFLSITSGVSGNGNGIVNYSVGSNSGAARSGTISIAGQTFTVNQLGTDSGPGPLTIVSGSNLPGGVVSSAYSTTLAASGGQSPYSWQVTSGSLPAGLVLTPGTGTISGTPTASGTSTFTIKVTDNASAIQSQVFTLAVAAIGSGGITITNTGFPSGSIGVAYQQVLTYASAVCGSPFAPPPVFTLASGSLPPGLTIQSLGGGYGITGTPTAPGTYNFALSVSNSCGQTGTATFSITITSSGTTTVLNATPQSLTFNVVQTGLSTAQQVQITSAGGSLPITVTPSTTSGGNWLAAAMSTQATPTMLNINVANYQALAPGAYQGAITVGTLDQGSVTILVTMNVAAGALFATPNTLTFNLSTNTSTQQTVAVAAGGSAVPFSAASQTASGGNWLSVQPASGTTPGNVTVLVNAAGLTAGKYTGTVTITQPASGLTAQVPVTLNVAPITLTVDRQTLTFAYQQGAAFPDAPSVNVISSGSAVPANVTASTVSGGAWLFVTPSGGQATTAVTVSVNPSNLAVGTYMGNVTIAPQDTSINTVHIGVTLTVTPGAGPVINGVVNAASGTPGQIAPGEMITIYGLAMSQATPSQLTLTSSNMISTSLAGTEVLFDGMESPLVYVSDTQINAIVPYELFGRTSTQLQVQYNGTRSTPVTLGVTTAAPGIFLAPSSSAPAQAAALDQDFSVNLAANGAIPGSVVILYATGEGQTNPNGVTGAVTGSTPPAPKLPVTVRIGGLPADVVYAGEAPGLAAGVMQVNVRIPLTVPRGAPVPVTITVGDATSNQATISIAP